MKKFVLFIILIFVLFYFLPSRISALTPEQIRAQIENTNSQIEALDKEIKKFQSQIAETSEQANSLAQTIKELNLTRSKLTKEKEKIQSKITVTGLVIENLSNTIESKEVSIQNQRETLAKMIKNLNQNDNIHPIERLLTIGNFSEFSKEYNNILTLNQKIKENIENISYEKDKLSTSKVEKEEEKQNLDSLKKDLVQKEQVVAITKKEKDSLLNQTKNQEAEYKKLLAERQKIRDTFEKALEEYEAQLKFILNPKLIPAKGSGVLSWPLDSILVTSSFGDRCLTLNGYYSCRFHYGTDFRASTGTPVKAMASGVVEGTGDTDLSCKNASFGKWIFIRYNNGLASTYGHLSVISAKPGQIVKAGDVVGLSGNTGASTAPHLHVSVYASGGVNVDTVPSQSCSGKIFTQPISAKDAHLNPADYLPPITPAMIKK
jgi:murein DD-endopeptidase MepM/ murein hydrolase activator NlpD